MLTAQREFIINLLNSAPNSWTLSESTLQGADITLIRNHRWVVRTKETNFTDEVIEDDEAQSYIMSLITKATINYTKSNLTQEDRDLITDLKQTNLATVKLFDLSYIKQLTIIVDLL